MLDDVGLPQKRGLGATIMDWDKLRIFHAVAEAGSFTHAGELLNLSQSLTKLQPGSCALKAPRSSSTTCARSRARSSNCAAGERLAPAARGSGGLRRCSRIEPHIDDVICNVGRVARQRKRHVLIDMGEVCEGGVAAHIH